MIFYFVFTVPHLTNHALASSCLVLRINITISFADIMEVGRDKKLTNNGDTTVRQQFVGESFPNLYRICTIGFF